MKKGLILTTALAMVLGVGVAVSAHQVAPKEASAVGNIDIYFAGVSGWEANSIEYVKIKVGTSGDFQNASVTTGDDVAIGQYKLSYPSASNQTSLNMYFKKNTGSEDRELYHPDSGDEYDKGDYWNTDYSTIKLGEVAALEPGHKYVITFNGWNHSYDNFYHAWFDYTFEEYVEVDPTTVKYFAKFGGGSYEQMTYARSFVEEEKTVYEFRLTNVGDIDGRKVFFAKDEGKDANKIEPGASKVRSEQHNNLFYRNDNHEITIITDCSEGKTETLSLFAYPDGGFDTFLTGYEANLQTYYFTNNKHWEVTPYFYTYDLNGEPKVAWPGEQMSFADYNKDGDDRYSFTVDTNSYQTFIINNGNEGGDETKPSQYASYAVNGFYISGDEKVEGVWEIGSYEYVAAVREIWVGGVQYDLDPSSDPLESGVIAKYESEVINMYADDQIRYKVEGQFVDPAPLQAYGRNNTFFESYYRVLTTHSGKVYVKIMEDHSTQIFVTGIQNVTKGYHVYLNESSIIQLAPTEDVPEGFTGQTASESVTFKTGDKFRLVDTSSDVTVPQRFSAARFDEYSDDNFRFKDGFVEYIGEAATYDAKIYLKLFPGNDMIYVGQADPADSAAKAFAIEFNTEIGKVCKWDHSTVQKDLEDAWKEEATNFKALTKEAKDVLTGGESHIAEVIEFYAKYDSVYTMRKLGSGWNLENFLEKSFGSSSLVSPNSSSNIADNSVLIAVVSVIALTSISAITVLLVIKKRRHN